LVARCPAALRGIIEARGVGLLHCAAADEARIGLVVDLGATEQARLPERRVIVLLDRQVDLVHPPPNTHFPAALLAYLRGGRVA
jgi:HPr kinase/phosphorylase